MNVRNSVDEEAWAEIRFLYIHGEETVQEIGDRFGVSRYVISRRATAEDWPRRRTRRGPWIPRTIGAPGAPVQGFGPTQAANGPAGDAGGPRPATHGPASSPWTSPEIADPLYAAKLTVEKRLYHVLVRKLEKLEQRMISGDANSPADSEREMREIGGMIGSYEKLKAGAGHDATDGPARRKAPGGGRDIDRLREEIADRLERLHRRWKPEGGAR